MDISIPDIIHVTSDLPQGPPTIPGVHYYVHCEGNISDIEMRWIMNEVALGEGHFTFNTHSNYVAAKIIDAFSFNRWRSMITPIDRYRLLDWGYNLVICDTQHGLPQILGDTIFGHELTDLTEVLELVNVLKEVAYSTFRFSLEYGGTQMSLEQYVGWLASWNQEVLVQAVSRNLIDDFKITMVIDEGQHYIGYKIRTNRNRYGDDSRDFYMRAHILHPDNWEVRMESSYMMDAASTLFRTGFGIYPEDVQPTPGYSGGIS